MYARMKQIISALAGISNQALAKGDLPTRLKIFNWGDNESDRGVIRVTAHSAAALRQQIANQSYARIVIDFEHNSLKGHPNYQPPPRKHAGYGNIEVVEGDGIYLSAIDYTPAGKEFAKENSDLSPAVISKDGEVLGLLSCALLPNGSLRDVTFFSAEDPSSAAVAQTEKTNKETTMEITALEARVATLTSENQQLRTDLTALAGRTPAAAQITALEGKVTALETKLTALEAADLKRQKDSILESAVVQGKVVALEADVIGQMTVAQLTTHVDKLPVVVPLAARTPRVLKPTPGADDVLAQYNAIKDSRKRAAFYEANKAKLGG